MNVPGTALFEPAELALLRQQRRRVATTQEDVEVAGSTTGRERSLRTTTGQTPDELVPDGRPDLRGANLVVIERASARRSAGAAAVGGNSYYSSRCTERGGYTASARTTAPTCSPYILAKTRSCGRGDRAEASTFPAWRALQPLRDYLELLTKLVNRRSRSRLEVNGTRSNNRLWTVLETCTRGGTPLMADDAETI